MCEVSDFHFCENSWPRLSLKPTSLEHRRDSVPSSVTK